MAAANSTRSYAGRPVHDRRLERRERFLAAGLVVIADNGYAATSIADVCKQAGLGRRQFYEEFTNREALLVAIYDRIQQEAETAITAALAAEPSSDLQQIAQAAVLAYVGSVAADPRRVKIAFVEVVGVNEAIEEHRRARRHQWAAMFEAAVRQVRGEQFRPPGGYPMAAAAFIGAINGLVHEWSSTEPRPPVTDLIDVLTAILLTMVGPVSAAE